MASAAASCKLQKAFSHSLPLNGGHMDLAFQTPGTVFDGKTARQFRRSRPYVPRVNNGGNYCGHQPDSPRLELVKPTTPNRRPGILIELQERMKRYYSSPNVIPSLRNANKSKQKRQQRSERREACLALLAAIIEHTDLSSLRCGVPTPGGFMSLTLNYLVQFTGLHPRRAERAMADLKQANLITCSQPRQLKEDGSWRGLAAVKAVSKLLFTVFGLAKRLEHERERAADRLAKKVKKVGGKLTTWARNALVLGNPSKDSGAGFKGFVRPAPNTPSDNDLKARSDLLLAILAANPTWKSDQVRAEADRILAQAQHRKSY